MASPVIKVDKITKSYFFKNIFDDLSFEFTAGCYAIIGANGAGKSTLLSMMSGSVSTDAGVIYINNINLAKQPVKAKHHLSYVPDGVPVYPFMSGKALFNLVCAARKCDITADTEKLIAAFDLQQYMNLAFAKMSLGTQRKFLLAASTIGNPDIYLFDEPTNAIDQASREVLINYLFSQRDKKIIIFSTHDQDLIQRLNARVLTLGAHPICQLVS